ncbi:hypothetical protein [Hydrogenophaga sp. PAMC20947]|uniref:hypothetical protein n=1 Tax=Hydrogenophaga sp. PAMC20947 TaxID=2565558 RepID=UPI00109DB974|nr:hypothetical protein [Hydrogenophaga sp. PAMC20947]QCB47285.1 hypothetical protein E5678_15385 [Hydrogenophaga sp. PAMC20947]
MSEAAENTAAPTAANAGIEAAEATPPETPPDTTTKPAAPACEVPAAEVPPAPEAATAEAATETEASTEAAPSEPEATTEAAPDTPKTRARPIVAQSVELPLLEKLPEPSGDVHEVGLMAKMPSEKTVLVIQPDGQVRGTLAGGCRTLQWVTVHTASSVELGEALIKEESIDAIILSLDEGAEAIDFLTRIRLGECKVDAGVPVMTINHEATSELVGQLKLLGATRLLLHPFTLGDVLETVEGMWTPDGAPVVMPSNPEELKKATEAKAEAKAEMEAAVADKPDEAKAEAAPAEDSTAEKPDEIAAAASEGNAPAEPEASSESPVEETKAKAEAEAVPA